MKINKKYVMPLVVVFGMLFVSAALVGYLSNTVIADITVESPMVTGISLGHETWEGDAYPEGEHDLNDWETETPLPISVYGGESVTLYTMSENLANVETTGFEEAIVTNVDGVTCEDFESIIVRVDSIHGDLGYGTPQDVIALGACFVIDDYSIKLGSPGNSLWGVGETDVSEIVTTFKTDALGTYTFTYRVIPAV